MRRDVVHQSVHDLEQFHKALRHLQVHVRPLDVERLVRDSPRRIPFRAVVAVQRLRIPLQQLDPDLDPPLAEAPQERLADLPQAPLEELHLRRGRAVEEGREGPLDAGQEVRQEELEVRDDGEVLRLPLLREALGRHLGLVRHDLVEQPDHAVRDRPVERHRAVREHRLVDDEDEVRLQERPHRVVQVDRGAGEADLLLPGPLPRGGIAPPGRGARPTAAIGVGVAVAAAPAFAPACAPVRGCAPLGPAVAVQLLDNQLPREPGFLRQLPSGLDDLVHDSAHRPHDRFLDDRVEPPRQHEREVQAPVVERRTRPECRPQALAKLDEVGPRLRDLGAEPLDIVLELLDHPLDHRGHHGVPLALGEDHRELLDAMRDPPEYDLAEGLHILRRVALELDPSDLRSQPPRARPEEDLQRLVRPPEPQQVPNDADPAEVPCVPYESLLRPPELGLQRADQRPDLSIDSGLEHPDPLLHFLGDVLRVLLPLRALIGVGVSDILLEQRRVLHDLVEDGAGLLDPVDREAVLALVDHHPDLFAQRLDPPGARRGLQV
mmetsp:Transcript_21156/g.51776  ORF Transcript_21156/g.51776 Transcript_21156/m.51776 type:complete len:549 (+) Transcript_21156:526-2172(+)